MVAQRKHSSYKQFKAIDRLAEPWEAAEFARLMRDEMRPGGINPRTGEFEPGTPYTQVLSVIVNLRMASPVVSQDLEYPEEEKARRLKWREWLLAAYSEQSEALEGPAAKYVEIWDGQCFAGGCEGEAEPLHLLCLSCKEKQRQKKKLNKETCSVPGCDRPREMKMQSSYCEEHRKIYHRVRSRRDYAKKILQGGIYEREVSGADVLPEGLAERAENQQPEL